MSVALVVPQIPRICGCDERDVNMYHYWSCEHLFLFYGTRALAACQPPQVYALWALVGLILCTPEFLSRIRALKPWEAPA